MRPGPNASRRLEEEVQTHPEIEVVLVAATPGQLIDEDGPQREPLVPCLAQSAGIWSRPQLLPVTARPWPLSKPCPLPSRRAGDGRKNVGLGLLWVVQPRRPSSSPIRHGSWHRRQGSALATTSTATPAPDA